MIEAGGKLMLIAEHSFAENELHETNFFSRIGVISYTGLPKLLAAGYSQGLLQTSVYLK